MMSAREAGCVAAAPGVIEPGATEDWPFEGGARIVTPDPAGPADPAPGTSAGPPPWEADDDDDDEEDDGGACAW